MAQDYCTSIRIMPVDNSSTDMINSPARCAWYYSCIYTYIPFLVAICIPLIFEQNLIFASVVFTTSTKF